MDHTLERLAGGLRAGRLEARYLPDLRGDHRRLLDSGDPAIGRYQLVNLETDRVTNSLNTLSEEILEWLRTAI